VTLPDELQSVPQLQRQRYGMLDAWRGVACLGVVVLHSTPQFKPDASPSWVGFVERIIDQFWIGVPMFFVISGYCIAATADSTRRKQRGVGTFFYRRFRRIYPPYWIFLLFATVFLLIGERFPLLQISNGVTVRRPGEIDPGHWVGNVTLTETWLSTVCGTQPKFLFGHAWTLCYEEQFYAVSGLVLLFARKRFVVICNGVSLAMLAAYILVPRLGGSIRGTFLDGSWLAFGAGVWVYTSRNYARGVRDSALFGAPTGIAALLLITRHWENAFAGGRHPGMEAFVLSAAVFAVCLALLSLFDERLSRIGLVRPLSWCGTICYSLYLVHVPVAFAIRHAAEALRWDDGSMAVLVVMPLCVAASLLCAAGFHRAIEARFLNAPQNAPTIRAPQVPAVQFQET
jgi:peptidoglycan/LPS O-acetylase OafA/YrhL